MIQFLWNAKPMATSAKSEHFHSMEEFMSHVRLRHRRLLPLSSTTVKMIYESRLTRKIKRRRRRETGSKKNDKANETVFSKSAAKSRAILWTLKRRWRFPSSLPSSPSSLSSPAWSCSIFRMGLIFIMYIYKKKKRKRKKETNNLLIHFQCCVRFWLHHADRVIWASSIL